MYFGVIYWCHLWFCFYEYTPLGFFGSYYLYSFFALLKEIQWYTQLFEPYLFLVVLTFGQILKSDILYYQFQKKLNMCG